MSLIVAAAGSAQNTGVSVNATGTPSNPSAMLDVSSTSSGMLIPRMTRAQRDLIASPAASLLVFQTDDTPGFYFNAGTPGAPDWKKLTTTNDPAGGTVTSVSGTLPVTVTNGTSTPVVSVAPATTSSAGTMSAADKTKLDGLQNANGSETVVNAGLNVWVTGNGTSGNPYFINSTGGSSSSFTHYIGELYQGGIVVSVWKDDTGTEHGLIASLYDLAGPAGKWVQWSNVSGYAGTTSNYDGLVNTLAIISQPGHTASAAQLCYDYTYDGYDDWYLPSVFELNQVLNAAYVVNNVLGTPPTDKLTGDPGYWTSVEYLDDKVIFTNFLMGNDSFQKSWYNYVRAVRRF